MNNIIIIRIYLGIIFFLILFIFYLVKKGNKKTKELNNVKDDYNILNTTLSIAKADNEELTEQKNNQLHNNNLLNQRYNKLEDDYNKLQNKISILKLYPLKHLSFQLPNGEIANTVKVKTITNKENNKILKVSATIRKKVSDKFQDINVKPVFNNI